ncbi:rho GTPase-activating protein 45 [Echinops telfairi]|uniref:Rho GTPase-activating protein 45 n=1 Tax=Echinops telfairi TaxID=9371 RepID=A0AC59C724_ECHTE|nr:rho GTPase-activating protein 45 [Echinops telfairi]
MFSRKKRDLMKTPSISKKTRAGSPSPQALAELPRKDGADAAGPGTALEPPAVASSTKAAGTLKRPTSLSRHASAAGFPLSGPGTWTLGRGHRSPLTAANPADLSAEGTYLDAADDIACLLTEVARFAEALEKLRECVHREDLLEARRPLAVESLGEALRVIRQVNTRYPLLNTVETLTAAGNLINKVKGFHYECTEELDTQEFEKALETIAVSFSSVVSEFLMGEVDTSTFLSVPLGDPSQAMEHLYCQGGEGPPPSTEDCDQGCPAPEEVDMLLQRCEGGVDVALQYAKSMAKYMKDVITYLEKRSALELEFSKGLQKLVHHCRQSITQEPHMPLLSIYSLALEQDLELGHCMVQAAGTLQAHTFLQPLTQRRQEHERRRKEIKEAWHRAQRKLQDAEANLRKAKQGYVQRCEDHDKARVLVAKAEEEQAGGAPGVGSAGSKNLDKRRRLEEEAKNKAEEAMATYRTCVADAKTQKQELEDIKVTALRQLQDVVRQSDQIIKSVTISYYELLQAQAAPLPVNFHMLCESSKLYDPGQQYASHVRQLQRGDEPDVHYDFEPHVSASSWSPVMRARKGSFNVEVAGREAGSALEAGELEEGALAKERRGVRSHQVHKSWPTHTQGIYRVNGVKTRVEKLCQAFENGQELVELSQASPHDISNVLKLYLRQLPEPLLCFRLYHGLVGLAKDSLKAEAEAKVAARGRPAGGESAMAAAVAMAGRLRELLQDLPPENRATLQYLLRHLRRIVQVEQDNKMTPGNLGIVFGPTLLRPRPTEATVSLSSLVDYPHQARVVETLIAHYGLVFEDEPEETPSTQDGAAAQWTDAAGQVPFLEVGEAAAEPSQEGPPGSHLLSNDSDSELEEPTDLLSSGGAEALRHLSFLEQAQEASQEEGAHSGSEDELLLTHNTNQSNNARGLRAGSPLGEAA